MSVESFSNKYGEFVVNIPEQLQKQYQTVRDYKKDFELKEILNVPIETKQELTILLSRITRKSSIQ